MDVSSIENHIKHLQSSGREIRLESLQIQCICLEAMISRHKTWAKDKNNPEVAKMYAQVIDLLRQAAEGIERIHNTYRQGGDNHS